MLYESWTRLSSRLRQQICLRYSWLPISIRSNSNTTSDIPSNPTIWAEKPSPKTLHQNLGGKGDGLYASPLPLRWYLSVLVLYMTSAFAALAWALYGPTISGQRRVLRTGNTPVNQFYAGLALSAILAPAAMFLRLAYSEITTLHPFALCSRTAVRISDIDRIMDPGVFAIRAMLRYSSWFALVQAILLTCGFLLVPIGTLILTVDDYAPQSTGHAVVGIPDVLGNPYSLSISMGPTIGPEAGKFGPNDLLYPVLTALVRGIENTLPAMVIATPGVIGPSSTLNITFEPDVRYHGVVTYHWSGGCIPADREILMDWDGGADNITFTFPDGTKNSTFSSYPASILLWSNATKHTDSGIPLDGWTYSVQVGPGHFVQPPVGSEHVNYTQGREGLLYKGGAWISRMKCKPSLDWKISSCTWTGSLMDNCVNAPGSNTTELDTAGLDALSGYMSAVFWGEYIRREPLFMHPYQVFAYNDQALDFAYGVTALAISQITTAGYFGTATVSTTGQAPTSVYIVRLPVLVTVTCLLTLVVVLISADLILASRKQLPMRKTSFLTIATAVRGRWWDEELYGRCTLGRMLLRDRTQTMVRFGVDRVNPGHIGLAPTVTPIQREDVYYGVREVGI
jgi:hypothetical protein